MTVEINCDDKCQIKRQNRPVNVSCPLLSLDENKSLFHLIGSDCYTLATAVTQLLLSQPPLHKRWVHHVTGIACFIKDYNLRSYFFRIYSLKTGLLWEQEFFRGFEYEVVTPIFHCFETSNSMAAFSFAEVNNALKFGHVVVCKIQDKRARLHKRREMANNQMKDIAEALPSIIQPYYPNSKTNDSYEERKYSEPIESPVRSDRRSSSPFIGRIKNNYSSLRDNGIVRRRKISKSEISNPISCTFEHREHIGIDGVRFGPNAANGESVTTHKEFMEMLRIFQQTYPNLRACDLSEIIDQYGGMDRLKTEIDLTDYHSSVTAYNDQIIQRRPAPPPPPSRLVANRSPPKPPFNSRPTLPPPNPPDTKSSPDIPLAPSLNLSEFSPPRPPPITHLNSLEKSNADNKKPHQEEKKLFQESKKPLKEEDHRKDKKSNAQQMLLNEICNPKSRMKLKPVVRESPKFEKAERGDLMSSIKEFDRKQLKSTHEDNFTNSQNELSKNSSSSHSSKNEEVKSNKACSMMDQIKQELERRRKLIGDINEDSDNEETCWSVQKSHASDDEWNADNDKSSDNGTMTAF